MKIFKIISFLVFVLLVSNTTVLLRDYIKAPRNIRNFLFKEGDILEGLSTGPSGITVDYNKQISIGSPLVFGGVHSPNLEHQDAWNKLQEVGVTLIRRDFFIEYEVPRNITLDDYKNNVNDVQNPEKWKLNSKDWTNVSITNQIYSNAKKSGMKVMGILSYAPTWLTYSGTNHGVPKDWEVYEDIVKKSYEIHRDQLDFVEIWNEPTYPSFLDLTNSGMTREEAYRNIFFHAVKAIREVDLSKNDGKRISIGGPAGHDPTSIEVLERILQEDYLKNNLDFVSYHNYDHLPEPSWNVYRDTLKKYQKDNIPLFLTEWNSKGKNSLEIAQRNTNLAIPYTGIKFISFIQMGLQATTYYSMQPLNRTNSQYDDNTMGFYLWKNGKAVLLPQAKTFRLLSKSLALGKGESRIYESTGSTPNTLLPFLTDELSSVGFESTDGIKGMAVVNDQVQDKYVAVTLNGINPGKFSKVKIDMYVASSDYDGGQVISSEIYPTKNSEVKLELLLPSQSVIGLLLSPDTPLQNIIRTLIP